MVVKMDRQFLQAMRNLRGRYMARVRAGEIPLDKETLAGFDKELKNLHEAVLGKHKRSGDPVPSVEL